MQIDPIASTSSGMQITIGWKVGFKNCHPYISIICLLRFAYRVRYQERTDYGGTSAHEK